MMVKFYEEKKGKEETGMKETLSVTENVFLKSSTFWERVLTLRKLIIWSLGGRFFFRVMEDDTRNLQSYYEQSEDRNRVVGNG